ncbi:MAG: hypothetical protein ABR537_05790 [Gemmatimonadales bacterium]
MTGHPRTFDDHPAPKRHRVPIGALWFGILGAPAAWSTHTLLATLINSTACIAREPVQPPAGVQAGSATWIVLVVSTVVLLGVAFAALFIATRSWTVTREHPAEKSELLEIGEGRARFMAMSGILLGVLFTLVLLANGVSLLTVAQCSP